MSSPLQLNLTVPFTSKEFRKELRDASIRARLSGNDHFPYLTPNRDLMARGDADILYYGSPSTDGEDNVVHVCTDEYLWAIRLPTENGWSLHPIYPSDVDPLVDPLTYATKGAFATLCILKNLDKIDSTLSSAAHDALTLCADQVAQFKYNKE